MQNQGLKRGLNLQIYLVLGLVMIFCLLAAPPAMGDETLESISFANKWPEFSAGNQTAAGNGSYIYFAVGDALTVLDGATLEERSRIYLETQKGITGIVHDPDSNMVYASCGSGGFKVIDVNDPLSPVLKGELVKDHRLDSIYGSALDLHDNRVYLADFYFGLRIIDVSNPSNPNLLGYYEEMSEYSNTETGETYSGGHINVRIATINNIRYAFVLDMYYGLRVFDVSVDKIPRLIDRYDMRSAEYWGQVSLVVDLDVDDNFVYVTDNTHGLTILSLFSDPENPTFVKIKKAGQIETPGSASGLFLDAPLVYIADGLEGLFVTDIFDPEQPIHGGTYPSNGVYGVFTANDRVFVADQTTGFFSLSPTGSFTYAEAAVYDPPCSGDAVLVEQNHAYLLDNDEISGRMMILDLSPPGEYHLTGYVTTPGEANAIILLEDRAFVADGSAGVSVFDVGDKESPTLVPGAGIKNSGVNDVTDIALWAVEDGEQPDKDKHFVFYTDLSQGLFTAVLDDGGKIEALGRYEIDKAGALAVYEPHDTKKRYALVVNGTGITGVDVTDATAPSLTFFLQTPGEALDIAVKDQYALVAGGTGGVLLVDLTNLALPEIVSIYDTGDSARALTVHQSYVHTAWGNGGLQILGIVEKTATELTLITSYDTPGYAGSVCVAGDDNNRLTYVGDGNGGVVSFLHKDTLYYGIDEKPFTDSSHDRGWDRSGCFISTLF